MASESIPNEQQGSLERLGIATESAVPENILTPASAASVRFRQQRELGYYTKDVEAFVTEQVQVSLEYFVQRLHARDLDVHVLGSELDRAEVDIANLRAQLQLAEASAPFQDIINQAQQDPEVEAMIDRLKADAADLASQSEALEAQVAALTASNADMVRYSEEQDTYIDALENRIAELEALLSGVSAPDEHNVVVPTRAVVEPELAQEDEPYQDETILLEDDEDEEYELAAEEPVYEPEPAYEPEPEPEPAPRPAAVPAAPNSPVWQGTPLPAGLRPEDFE